MKNEGEFLFSLIEEFEGYYKIKIRSNIYSYVKTANTYQKLKPGQEVELMVSDCQFFVVGKIKYVIFDGYFYSTERSLFWIEINKKEKNQEKILSNLKMIQFDRN